MEFLSYKKKMMFKLYHRPVILFNFLNLCISLILNRHSSVQCLGMWWNLGFLGKDVYNIDYKNTNMNLTTDLDAVQNQEYRPYVSHFPTNHIAPFSQNREISFNEDKQTRQFNEQTNSNPHNSDMKSISAWCQLPGLSKGQQKLCVLYHDHMYGVGKGAQYGIHECQFQFRNQKWNCSIRMNDETVFGPILKIPSRETAFAHAINSAGVVHAISRFCRQGILSSCSCGKIKRPGNLKTDWKWAGCGDNLKYGYKFATEFVDIREREKFFHSKVRNDLNKAYENHVDNDDQKRPNSLYSEIQPLKKDFGQRKRNKYAKSLMNLHNNEAGRRAVYHTTQINCKCHGVSGACSTKTCWPQLGPFRKIGRLLKEKYDNATRVRLNGLSSLQVSLSPKGMRAKSQGYYYNSKYDIKVPTASDLVYLKKSPDFCITDPRIGFSGTKGRICGIDFNSQYPHDLHNNQQAFQSSLPSNSDLDDDNNFDELDNIISFHGGDMSDLTMFYFLASSIYDNDSPHKNNLNGGSSVCRNLCCGRGDEKKVITLKQRCHCKFQWCCDVKCSVCIKNVTFFVCR
ncbi:unnamed protein product [Gordionus sp. m RMFG-2023]